MIFLKIFDIIIIQGKESQRSQPLKKLEKKLKKFLTKQKPYDIIVNVKGREVNPRRALMGSGFESHGVANQTKKNLSKDRKPLDKYY